MNNSSISDTELVRQYISGSENALEEIIARHKDRIYGYIKMMVKSHDLAEDVFQDTFIKAIKTLKAGNYNEEGKFLPWIMRIAHNLIIDHFRRVKRMPTYSGTDDFDIFDVIKSEDQNIDEKLFWDQVHVDVKKLIDYLPDEQREVLEMRIYQDLSFKEISDLTNVSINTALGRMRYALINLRKIIKENNLVMSAQ